MLCQTAQRAIERVREVTAAKTDDDIDVLRSLADDAVVTLYQNTSPSTTYRVRDALDGLRAETPEGLKAALEAMQEVKKGLRTGGLCPS